MKLYLKYFLVTAMTGLLFACSSSKSDVENIPEQELYQKADQELKNGNIKSSIKLFEQMDKAYPFGAHSQQVQLDLIYAYYKTGNYALAISSIDRFIKLNPTHPNIDWVLYLRGISNMDQDDNQIQGWFNIDRSDRETSYALAAFKDFNYLVSQFPNSTYSYDATKRLVFIKNRLAKHELKIAQYYDQRKAYIAVVNRVSNMMKTYPDTDSTKKALVLMRNAYEKMGLKDDAEKTEQLIQANSENVSSKIDDEKPFLWIF